MDNYLEFVQRLPNKELEKTKDFVMGNYGKKEHLWCLPKKPESFSQSTLPF